MQKRSPYRVDVRFPDGRRVTKVFQKKAEANRFRDELKEEKKRILYTGISFNDRISLKEYASEWFKTVVKGRKSFGTQRNYECDLKNYILPLIGKVPLKDLNVRHARIIENFMIEKGKRPRTINKVIILLKTMLNDAVTGSYLLRNPLKGHPKLKEPPRTIVFWSKEEVETFLKSAKDDPLFDLYLITLNTGMRLGEILGLCWDKVDFENNLITISRALGREGLKNTTKSNRARFIPMNSPVKEALLKRFKSRISDKFVMCNTDGSPLDYEHMVERHFKKAQEEAGIKKIIRFHDLRHTFASHFMMNGGSIYTLQKLLGHSDIETTMVYAHLDKEFIQGAAEVVRFEVQRGLSFKS